ncbi:MAG: hypothetical protein LAP40_05370 [Acidobacteriia bacterium]|nr:hypothetical protein [Terriglobia bacterium]
MQSANQQETGEARRYLGLWESDHAISDKQAAKRFAELLEGRGVPSEFNGGVYAFCADLTAHYPEIDMVPEEDLESCPWACAMESSAFHVILALRPDGYPKVFPLILQLADVHGLVCFDPQVFKVHLPSRLKAN